MPPIFLAPDGDAGRDVYAVLREAIAKTGKMALSRVVISQRERTIALRPMDDGLMAHTLYEDRDLNSGKELFEGMAGIKVDPEMVQLATQLVQRQSGKYDASDLEDRYETRLRAMIDAKLKGEGIDRGRRDAARGTTQRGGPDGSAEEEPRADAEPGCGEATGEEGQSAAPKRAAAAQAATASRASGLETAPPSNGGGSGGPAPPGRRRSDLRLRNQWPISWSPMPHSGH